MLSQRTWNRITSFVVLFVLVLAIGICLISTSPAVAVELQKHERIAELEQMLSQAQEAQQQLLQTNSQLSALVDALRAELETEYVLVLRHEDAVLPSLFGSSITVNSRIQEISVSKALFDSCEIGDNITTTDLHRFLASGTLRETRVIVEDKFTR